MASDTSLRLRCVAALIGTAGLLFGCAAAVTPAAPPPLPSAVTVAAPAPPPAPASAPQPPAVLDTQADPVAAVLAHADRIRTLAGPELGQEIARLGDAGGAPARQMQLALALLQTRVPADGQRAQGLLLRVLGQHTAEARPLHSLARLLMAQHAELRRIEEQLERQAQQVRDGLRRIDQLNDRLQALRAIERSLPSRATP